MFLSIKALSEFSFQFLDKKARSLFVLSLTNLFANNDIEIHFSHVQDTKNICHC